MADIGPIAQGYTHSYGAFDGRDAPNRAIGVVLMGTPEAGGDATPPTVTVVSPAPGSTMRPDTEVVVDVTDETGLRLVELHVTIPGGATEVVAKNGDIRNGYRKASSRSPITKGFRYRLRRDAGWPRGVPKFEAVAIDTSGNEAT